jgi:hypothetical protein
MQDCEEMSAEQLWALESGFHCDAAQRGKGANSPFFLSRSRRFSFFALAFSLRSHALFWHCTHESENKKKVQASASAVDVS